MIPKYYIIKIYKSGKIGLDDDTIEFYQREEFTEEEIKNRIEKDVRDNIWRYINENDIQIIIE